MSYDFSPYQAVLLDLDGTVYHEEQPLPGALELIRQFQAQRRVFACLSNSTASPSQVSQRLTRMGVQLALEQIFTAAAATVDYVLAHYGRLSRRPRVFSLATEGVQTMLDQKVDWVQTADQPCDVVIAANPVSVYATEPRMRTGLQLLRNGAALVGICADRVYPSPRGMEFGCGAMTEMLAYAADVKPTFCGKPERIFYEELCQQLKVRPESCILIGDNIESDVAGAKQVGMRTILTLTGVARRQDLAGLPPNRQPDEVISDLTELL